MCGINCTFSRCDKLCLTDECHQPKNKRLLNRGPDHQLSEIHQVNGKTLALSGYVLHIQGHHVCPQPLSSKQGSLLFNGQIFCRDDGASSVSNDVAESDTIHLLGLIEGDSVIDACSTIKGPYALIYFDASKNELWFSRDYWGRRSMLLQYNEENLTLTSLRPDSGQYIEVPAVGIFCFSLKTEQLRCYLYENTDVGTIKAMSALFKNVTTCEDRLVVPVSPLNIQVDLKYDVQGTVEQFLKLLAVAVERRNKCCVYPLDFTDTAIEEYDARHCFCSDSSCTAHSISQCVPSTSRVGVLFSGGVDCTLLACLLHRCVPADEPIDLLNVAFGNTSTVPDRLTAHSSLLDLQHTCPGRMWNLVEIDISLRELQFARSQYIADLIYPHCSVLDDSIGCALWFAARGVGLVEGVWTYSTARLLFSGIGADELMGGYSRHRSAFERGGLSGVVEEIGLDIDRISSRNLGRDNRVIGDHHRDCVAPFLDFDFVSFINDVPISTKVDFSLPRGEGEKWILRQAAQSAGLSTASRLPKRAIQFGSKIAKLEKKKEKGGDVCQRLEDKKVV